MEGMLLCASILAMLIGVVGIVQGNLHRFHMPSGRGGQVSPGHSCVAVGWKTQP
jgi:hypothetical protein